MAFQVSGTPAPMMAVVGKGSEPVAMPYPQQLTVVMPGRGETTAPDVAGLPATSMHIALSNMSGIWLAHYAVVTVNGLADAIDREGGLPVTLTAAYPTKAGPIGPGSVTLTGAQTKAFLTGTTDDAGTRWELVLKALLADPPTFEPAEIDETDDAAAAAEVFSAAKGAEITDVPTDLVTESIEVPAYPELDALMAGFFDTSTPTPAIVQNGSGAPGVGEGVATQIIPAGFRITLSQNAQTFDVETTDVFANGVEFEEAAERAREALGVGRVRGVPGSIGYRRYHDRRGEGLHGLTETERETREARQPFAAAQPRRRRSRPPARPPTSRRATSSCSTSTSIIVITDFFVICSAGTQRQIRTVIDAVEDVDCEAWA